MASRRKIPSAVVGLDIGSDSIKVAEARYGKGGITITGLGIAPTPPGMIENEVIVDPKGLGLAIKKLLAESGIKTRTCVSAVSGQSRVVVRIIEVPKMSEKELAETMKWEVERHVPFSPTQVVMDFKPLEKANEDPNAQNMEVLLAVAQDELVNNHVETLLAAGLKPVAIDIEPLAVSRSLIEAGKNGVKEELVAIINIGNRNADLGVFEGGGLTFPSPPLGISGSTLTEEIAQALGETPEKAEMLKREYASVNLAGLGSAPSAATPDVAPSVGNQEPTMTNAGTQGLDAATFIGPGFDSGQTASTAEHSAQEPQNFRVTVDGPIFDTGEEPSADISAGPKFDLGELDGLGVEPTSDEAPTFDLTGSQPQVDESFKPDFDLEEETPSETEVPAVPALDLGDVDHTVGQPGAAQSAIVSGSIPDRVFQAISGPLVDLATEIRKMLDYYASTRSARMPDRIFLCGGTAKIPHLDEFLANELGVKVEVGDPVANLNVRVTNVSERYLHEISPFFAVSIGLAIRDMIG